LETGSCYVAQAGPKLTVLLTPPPECWDYKCATMSDSLFLLDCISFLEQFLGSQRNWADHTGISIDLLLPHDHSPPPYQHKSPPTVIPLLLLENLHGCIITNQSPKFTLAFTLGAVHAVHLRGSVIMCMQHCIIMLNISPPKNPLSSLQVSSWGLIHAICMSTLPLSYISSPCDPFWVDREEYRAL
jgi:hypothetical protein